MVVQNHLFAVAGEATLGGPFAPTVRMHDWVTYPLANNQYFCWLGVWLFFLISRFLIAPNEQHEPLPALVVL